MKTRLYILLSLLILVSCSSVERPSFKKVENIRITDITLDSITVTAEAIFFNPNMVGLNILSSNTDVKVNEVMLSNIKQHYALKVNGNEEFRLPLEIKIPPKAIFGKESGLLSSVLQVLGNKKAELQYKGNMKVDLAGVKMDVPFEFSEEVPIKL